jgi:hypothetical protein
MAVTLFKDTTYTLAGLVENIRRGEIGLPDIQRPFVWPASKVRDLFDSMYKGFPVGYLLFWATTAEVGARQIGAAKKEAAARLLIVDGQQRLTSLFAVLTGTSIVRKDYTEGPIRLAFCPAEARFEVTDAAVEKDPEFIPDITEIWRAFRETSKRYFARLTEHRGQALSDAEAEKLEAAIDRLRDLHHFPFKAVELDASVDEERVAEIFVRINSEGVQLNQADFILTLMSVFWEDGRKQLEAFSRAGKSPSKSGPSPYNHFIEAAPDQLTRVTVGLAFRRGRLQHVYSLLRGKDLETGMVSAERRGAQFKQLREAQDFVLDLTNWHEFLKCLGRAGFRSARMISSQTALLYSYVLWSIGKRDFDVPFAQLREVIARWFFMAHTTGRYTNSPESQIESDLLRLRDIKPKDATAFCEQLDREIATVFTNDYWTSSLPNRLDRSGAKSPALLAYWAALNLLDAELLFSTTKVAGRLDPGVSAVRDIERHHIFPKNYLEESGIRGASKTNQIANMSFIDWSENTEISDKPPSLYWPVMAQKVDPERLKRQQYWHALPVGWEQLQYDEFLEKRRKLIASVVRDGFERLLPQSLTTPTSAPQSFEQLIAAGESQRIEFKSSCRWNETTKAKDSRLEHVVSKTLAGFANAEGGTLLLGVNDSLSIPGLDGDYQTLAKPGRDGFELFLIDLAKCTLSGVAHSLLRIGFAAIGGKDVCKIDVGASARPVFVRPVEGKELTEFWVRTGNSTRQLVGPNMVEYQRDHWD